MSIVSLVYAVSRNGVIGRDGGLPWHIPSDLKHFKAITLGKPVIMGRKTWDSLPRKPLPGRRNLVISRNVTYRADGAEVLPSLEAALRATAGETEVCVIGGAEIFKAALPLAHRIYLTRVLADVAGDTIMPELSAKHWREVERQSHVKGEKDSSAFDTIMFERR
jgi:dihydrofolate reductase